MGIDEVFYTSCSISLREGRIQRFVATVVRKDFSQNQTAGNKPLSHGLAGSNPAEFSRLCTPEGDLIYNAANGGNVSP